MSLTPSEVSKIIEKSTATSNPQELPLKGLHFGKLWYKAGDYNSAAQWIVKYLKTFDRDTSAHKLLGDCYEKLSEIEAALSCFKRSLQIKPNQPELLLHIVELYLNPGPAQNPNKAQIWLDKAAASLPGNATVFKMKMELMLAQQASPSVLEKAILQELKRRSNDPALHVQYVSFMRTQDRLEDAYAYCVKIENILDSASIRSDYKWSSCVVSTYKEHTEKLQNNQQHSHHIAQLMLLEALSRFIWVCLEDNKQQKALEKLQMMDECLSSVLSNKAIGDWKVLAAEMEAQLCWLAATFLIQQAAKNEKPWGEASDLAAVLFSSSVSKSIPSSSCAWSMHCLNHQPYLPSRVQRNAAQRLSQSSHMMWILSAQGEEGWIAKLRENLDQSTVGLAVFQSLFHNTNSSSSYLCNTTSLASVACFIPTVDEMMAYDNVASASCKLDMLIWLGIRWMKMDMTVDFLHWVKSSFPNLQMVTSNSSAGASLWSLSLLDIEAFIAACVYTTEKKAQHWESAATLNHRQLSSTTLPLPLCRKLTTDLQNKWWSAAVKLSNKKNVTAEEAGKLKPILQRGLECLRGVGNHGLEVVLITKLAKYFASKSYVLQQETGTSTSWFLYQRRAALYWSLALPDLMKSSDGRVVHQSKAKERLFSSIFNELNSEKASSLLSEAYMCHGELAAQENRFDEALSFYSKATIPQASFCQAHLYRQMAENVHLKTPNLPLFDLDQKKEALMRKYRRCLEITLTRLQQHPDDNLHERTVRLITSPRHSPLRNQPVTNTTANKSGNDSILAVPSKQSTPKMNETSHTILSGIEERDTNVLVDTISSLTSALSNLQMEMGFIREEQKRNMTSYYSPSAVHPTATNIPGYQHMMMSPNFISQQHDRMHAQNQFTPQRPFTPVHPGYYPGRGVTTPVPGRPLPGQMPSIDPYQQQQQPAYYSPTINPYASSYQPDLNKYTMPTYHQPQAPILPAYQNQTFTPEPMPATYKTNQPPQPNLLTQRLQNKDAEILQQKLSQSLSGSPAPPNASMGLPLSSIPPKNLFTPTSIPFVPPVTETPKPVFAKQVEPSVAPMSLVQKLLLEDKHSSRAISAADVTPTKDFQFLGNFVNLKQGETMKFQSPEQMDRENQELDAQEHADAEDSSNNDTGPHFDPIVALPDLVEVSTGEENEDVLFQERCKLFRWDRSEWKERGIGNMKVLKHKVNAKVRLVMRREQVHKVCCNQYVSSSTSLSQMANSDKAMIWFALDFAEDEPREEKLAAKFKTHEIAVNFRDTVNQEAAKVGKGKTQKSAPSAEPSQPNSNKPDKEKSTSALTTTTTLAAAASSFKFKMPTNVTATDSQPEPEISKPSIFGNLAGAIQTGFGGTGSEGGIRPGAFKFSFGSPKPKATTPVPAEDKDEGKKDEDARSPSSNLDTSEGPHIDPIVDLPNLVDVGTGEENEEAIFCSRAKLYRYIDAQWKERGLGEMKILRHKNSNKYRVVMRREQVLKICANHCIAPAMQLKSYGDTGKAWTWSAMDFSDPELDPQHEVFAVRFKTVELANEFKENFEKAFSVRTTDKGSSLPPPTTPSSASVAFLRKDQQEQKLQEQKLEEQKLEEQKLEEQKLEEQKLQEQKSSGSFKITKEAGSWNCNDCYAGNSAKHATCPCCGSANPNQPAPAPVTGANTNAASNASAFKFGVPTSTTAPKFKFGEQASSSPRPASTCLENILLGKNVSTTTNAQTTTDQKFSFKFGGDLSKPAASSKFQFGSPQPTDNKEPVKEHTALQRTGQTPTNSSFSFKLANSNNSTGDGKPFSFGSQTTAATGLFSAPSFGAPPPNTTTTTNQTSQPKFPTMDSENEEENGDESSQDEENDDDYSTEESEGSYEDEEEEDFVQNHQSPMSKFTAPKTEGITVGNKQSEKDAEQDEDDVICVGEVLPSQELQEKAKSLQLHPSFYNYLKDGEEADSEESSATASDKPETENLEKPALKSDATKPVEVSTSTFAFGSNTGDAGIKSFADLAASSSSGFKFGATFTPPTSQPVWSSDGKPIFSTTKNNNSDLYQEEEERDIHVEPIAKLPDLVTVVTGEEGERTIYSQRSKLFRWDKTLKQWKERGLGDICIKHNQENGKFRIVMRREQVFKVCANHYITSKMKLTPMPDSDRTWTWIAADFADGEETEIENFAIKFKTCELANLFKEKFEECQVLIDDTNATTTSAFQETTTDLINQAEKMKSELDFFKDKLSVKQKIDLENTLTEGAEVKSLPKLPDLALTPLVKQHQKDKERIQSETSPPTDDKQADKENVEVTRGRTRNTSISLSKFEFNMKVDPTMPEHGSHKTRNISVCSATSTEEADIHVEPIVPLPDKVDVPTGEEQDQVLFENRVKLFVFHRESKQWKERGLGRVRILQNLNNYRIRLVMRREQVFKVCLNHFITEAIHFNFKENSDKVLVWAATDFSDPDKPNGEMLQFAMKLKSAETAINFLNTVQDGNEAFSVKRLLDPVSVLEDKSEINTSVQDASNASQQSENGNTSVHKSPVKSTKPAFSFANVATPFGNKNKPLFSDIVFGTPKTQPAAPTTKFTFDASSISFNFGSTSTPATSAPPFQIAPAVMQKPAASKSLFGVVQPSTGNNDASQQKEQNTIIGQHSSKFQFDMATADNDQNGVDTNVGEKETKKVEKDAKPVELVETDTNDEKDSEKDDDVIFVWEAVPTQSQLERSRKLQLPPCFFLYEDNPDLEGSLKCSVLEIIKIE
nr:E3 SUMO-protein ligase RanBP2 [Ciona intestinalis]|eukprot:XP_026691293.1 E3 SUMO-protein ligase RanBP2 [Ciona intestinalis]